MAWIGIVISGAWTGFKLALQYGPAVVELIKSVMGLAKTIQVTIERGKEQKKAEQSVEKLKHAETTEETDAAVDEALNNV